MYPNANELAYVGVFDLAEELSSDGLASDEALRRARLLAIELNPGPINPSELRDLPGAQGRVTGFMVTSGMLLADVTLAGRTATQLLGPGDVIGAFEESDGPLGAARRLAVERRATLAVLDDRLLAVSHRWPAIAACVLEAGMRQLERAAVQQAISQLSRVELRLLALMLHLAGRWGRVTSDGLVLDLDVTHALLGQLVGARRPTVSLALKCLADEGLLTRRDDGAWRIAPAASDLLSSAQDPATGGNLVLAPMPSGQGRRDGASAA
jgi:CRP/FNR family cyclic AMP-dependent transcriptional regulator